MTDHLDTVRALKLDIENLTLKLARLQAENRALRRKVKENGQDGRILRQAHRDALIMLSWHYAGLRPTRSFSQENGISKNRWAWARALLMSTRIHDGEDIVVSLQPEDAMRLLQRTVSRMEEEGIMSLRLHNRTYRS